MKNRIKYSSESVEIYAVISTKYANVIKYSKFDKFVYIQKNKQCLEYLIRLVMDLDKAYKNGDMYYKRGVLLYEE